MHARDSPLEAAMGTLSARLVVATVGLAELTTAQLPVWRDDTHRVFSKVLLGLRDNLGAGCIHVIFDHEDQDLSPLFLVGHIHKNISMQGIQTATLSIVTFAKVSDRLQCSKNLALNAIIGGSIARINDALIQISRRARMSNYHWLLYQPAARRPEDVGDVFKDVDIPVDCEFVVAGGGADGGVVLAEVYRLAPNLSLRWNLFGTWSPDKGFRGPADLLHSRRTNLHGITFTAATINEPPITILKADDHQPLRVEGFFGKLWALVETRMNFTTRFVVPEDRAWGGLKEDGSWDGMIGMLVRGEAQLAVAEFSMTPLRIDVVDFTFPLIYTKNCVFIKHVNTDSSTVHWTAYLAPFGVDMWATIGVFVLFMSAVFFVAYNLTHKYVVGDEPPERSSYIDCLVFVFGAFCQQGLDVNTRTCSLLTLSLATYLTAITVYASYSAQLISYLTVREYQLPFETLEQLLEMGTYRLGVLANSGQLNNFNKATDPLMKQLYASLIAPDKDDLPPTIEEGLRRICEIDHYAFMTSFDVVLGLLENVSCNVVAVPFASYKESLAIAIAKNNSYKNLIDNTLQVLRRNGVWHKLRVTEWPVKMPVAEESIESVSLVRVMPLASVLVTGITTALLLFCYEYRHRIRARLTNCRLP